MKLLLYCLVILAITHFVLSTGEASFKESAQETGEKIGNKFKDAAMNTKESAESFKQQAEEKGSQFTEKVKDTAESIKEKAGEYAEKAKEKAGEFVEQVKDTAGSIKDKASEYVGIGKEKVKEGAENVQENVKDTKNTINEKTHGLKDTIKEKSSNFLGMVEKNFEDIKKKFMDTFSKLKFPDDEEDDDLSTIWNLKGATPLWQPSSELIETPLNFIIRMELPGMKKEDIKVELKVSPDVSKRSLIVSGVKRMQSDKEKGKHHLKETYHGEFQRAWTFGASKILNDVSAEYNHGVLTVEIKKKIDLLNKDKRIEVK